MTKYALRLIAFMLALAVLCGLTVAVATPP